MQLTGADRSCDHLVNEHARDSATSTDTAPAGCGSNGVGSEFPDLLVIQETGRREDLVSLAQRRCADPERAKAHSDAATPPGYHWFLPMELRPAKANRPNLQGIHNLQLSRPELT